MLLNLDVGRADLRQGDDERSLKVKLGRAADQVLNLLRRALEGYMQELEARRLLQQLRTQMRHGRHARCAEGELAGSLCVQ